MKADRAKICKIVSEMLDDPDEAGIYPTGTCFTKLEHYLEEVRMQSIGWMHAVACITLDKGGDPRLTEVPDIIARARIELEGE